MCKFVCYYKEKRRIDKGFKRKLEREKEKARQNSNENKIEREEKKSEKNLYLIRYEEILLIHTILQRNHFYALKYGE